MKLQRFGNQKNIVALFKALLGPPLSIFDLVEKTGVSYDTTRPLIKRLHAEGLVHISHWKVDAMGRQCVAVYALGYGQDAPKRRPKTQAERSRASYLRHTRGEVLPTVGNVGRLKAPALDHAMRGWLA
jgi:predicted ArsR family transcriptional regulator